MKKNYLNQIIIVLFLVFVIISFSIGYDKGEQTAHELYKVIKEMIQILPCAFILIGLFEVWIKKETVIRHLGDKSSFLSYFWVLILAGFTVGGLYTAFPLIEILYKKGASLKVIFAYIGFVGVCRIPMTIFEMSFIGIPFSATRLLITIPLFLLFGIVLGIFLRKKNYKLNLDQE